MSRSNSQVKRLTSRILNFLVLLSRSPLTQKGFPYCESWIRGSWRGPAWICSSRVKQNQTAQDDFARHSADDGSVQDAAIFKECESFSVSEEFSGSSKTISSWIPQTSIWTLEVVYRTPDNQFPTLNFQNSKLSRYIQLNHSIIKIIARSSHPPFSPSGRTLGLEL
jgi:hypothetical protein